MYAQDRINHAAWVEPAGVNWLAQLEGFTDEGERAAYARVAELVHQGPILDLGVGGGRTVKLLRALSDDYVAIDYTPQLVESAHRRFPDADIRVGDARDLSAFGAERFSLVVFSYMGIDSVDHEDRQRILREVWRVLKPGGIFWFSTLNLDGSAPRERPWRPHLSSADGALGARALELTRTLKRIPRDTLNYVRGARRRQQGRGWLIAPFFAYSYGLLVHYTTLENQLAELRDAGFAAPAEVFEDTRGARLAQCESRPDVCCFNILALKS
ncbi:MAG: ubiE/COQ5 methyltransferase family protein [Myxococcaceae bacterium]|nr:ubiE/COQ5 methyltransferase family protein [Myxococcaceae bacterium]